MEKFEHNWIITELTHLELDKLSVVFREWCLRNTVLKGFTVESEISTMIYKLNDLVCRYDEAMHVWDISDTLPALLDDILVKYDKLRKKLNTLDPNAFKLCSASLNNSTYEISLNIFL